MTLPLDSIAVTTDCFTREHRSIKKIKLYILYVYVFGQQHSSLACCVGRLLCRDSKKWVTIAHILWLLVEYCKSHSNCFVHSVTNATESIHSLTFATRSEDFNDGSKNIMSTNLLATDMINVVITSS